MYPGGEQGAKRRKNIYRQRGVLYNRGRRPMAEKRGPEGDTSLGVGTQGSRKVPPGS